MMNKAMRAAIMKKMSSDPQAVIKAINANPEESKMIKAGRLDMFNDEQLSERFNTKVMGMLGMSKESMGMEGGMTGNSKMEKPKMNPKKMDGNQ
jgi:hypothetical protein